jgi:hypothetical protein
MADIVRAADLHASLTPRAMAAEAVAAAATTLLQHWATWALLQAGAIAGHDPDADRRRDALIDGGAGNLLDEDPDNAISAARALETLDAALTAWAALAGLAPPAGNPPR